MVSQPPPIVVGRNGELALARRIVADLRQGLGTTLLVEGEAGIGKSRVLQWMAGKATTAGIIALRGEGHPFERSRPFGVIVDALDLRRRSPDRRRAAIAHLLAGDAERSGARGGAQDDRRYQVVEQVVDLVEEGCGESPVLLVLEDLHWADSSTLLAIRSLIQRLAHAPLALALSFRPAPRSSELEQLLDEALRTGAHHMRLAATARQPATEVVAGLREAFQARLLGEQGDAVVFRHQLVHDAIYQTMPLPVRRALHRDAAGTLARSGAEILRVADHLVLGAGRGDLEAIRWLRAAARDAGAGAPTAAVELLRRAESMLPGGHPDADLIAAELVEALLRAGNVGEAAARAEAVLDRRHRMEADARLRVSLISALSLQNRPVELIERAEAALNEAPDLSPADRSLVLAQASYGRTFSGDLLGGEAMARRALEQAESCGDVATMVWSLTTMSIPVKSQGRYAEALDLTRRALALAFEPPNLDARLRHPLFFHGLVLSDSDRPADARVAFDKALEECDALQSAWLLPDTILMSAEARFLAGAWDDAVAEIEAGLAMANERGQRILVGQSLAYQAIIAEGRGDHGAARAALRGVEALLEAHQPPVFSEMVAYASSLSAEAEGDQDTAFRRLLSAWDHDAGRGNRYYHRYLGPGLVRLALALEDRITAERVSEMVTSAAALAPEVPSVQSAAFRCRGLVGSDAACLVDAVALARGSGRVLDHAGACEDAAQVLAELGRRGEATDLLVEAADLYDSLDARAWVARAEAALRRLGLRRGTRGPRRRPTSGWESLTETERDVSMLVADGLTNREVARRLHISPHTVNTHLRHVFQKLSVSNRAGLAVTVARSVQSPA